MSEFKLVQHPTFSPTTCITCSTHGGPFIDTEVETLGYGHHYICAKCVTQMGRLVGLADPETLAGYEKQIERLTARLDALEEALNARMVELPIHELVELMQKA